MTRSWPNIPLPTGGGRQLWLDVEMLGGWRIQRHLGTDHFRLLDPSDVRRAWGDEAACREALDLARRTGAAVRSSPRLVVLLHGYLRTKNALKRLKRELREAGFEVHDPNLPTMLLDVPALTQAVDRLLEADALAYERIDIVGHSLGGILARHVLAKRALPGGGRLVMMAPPNQGSKLAQRVLATRKSSAGRALGDAIDAVFGKALSQLGTDERSLALHAPRPACDTLVLAGTKCPAILPLRAKDGPSDGIVTVEEAKLPGCAQFLEVPASHTFIMDHPQAIAATIEFLRGGAGAQPEAG